MRSKALFEANSLDLTAFSGKRKQLIKLCAVWSLFLELKALGMSVTSHSKTSPQQIALKKYSGEWYQEWSVVSDSVILMEAGGNATQTWSPRFVDPGYELALHPGFPGDMEIVDGESCLASTQDQYLGQSTMQSCDESMALLVGSKVSVGRLRAIADLIQEKGASRMPGYCCMDVATDSEFFGYNVSDANECN